jgi:hypothetical protein
MVTQQMLVSVTEQWIVYQNSMAFSNSIYSMDNIVNSLSLDLNSRFSDKFSNQLLITSSKRCARFKLLLFRLLTL